MEWIAEQVMNLLDMINGSILGALGCNMNTFTRYFPAAETMYGIFVGLGLGILLLNFIWQLFRNFGLGIGLEAEDPLKLTFRTILFMGLVFFSQEIVDLVLKIGGTPYEWIVDTSLPPIQFASFMSVITVVIGGTVGGSVLLIALVLLIILAWNYIKLLFEAAERYILLGVLVFTAPVAFALGGSQSTSNIWRSWCRMLGGQLFLLVMNAWCLKLFTNMFGEFIANPLGTGDGGNLFIWFLCAIAFLKVSQKIDSFMAGLGISVGHTGGNMLGEALIAAKSLGGFKKGGMGGGAVSGKTGGIPNPTGTAAGAFSGGLAGMVSRKAAAGAASNLTSEKSSSGGFFGSLGSKMYESSVGETGGFASRVIGGVATGTASQNGVISGEKAVDAFQAYMGPMGGGIPATAAEESDSFSGMQPTVTPETSILTSPDGAAEPEPDMAPLPADNLQAGENQIAMSPEEEGEASASIDTGPESYIGTMPDTPQDIPYGPESVEADTTNDLSEVSFGSSEVSQSAGIPAGMEEGGIDITAGAEIPASASTGGTVQETASLESSLDTQTALGGGTTIPSAAATTTPSGGSGRVSEDTYSPGAQSAAFAGQYAGRSGSPYTEPPTFRNIEMGSGRITGTEISPQHPTGIQFAMYHAGQYTQPEGKFTTVTSKDGEKWYKQYAVPTVERTPVRTETDKRTQQEKVICDEKIVQKLPRAPARRDR